MALFACNANHVNSPQKSDKSNKPEQSSINKPAVNGKESENKQSKPKAGINYNNTQQTNINQYGLKARMDSQNKYFKSLTGEKYLTQSDSWSEKTKTRREEFNNILKREYLAFAQKLNKEKDYTDSSFFRRKGLDAAKPDFKILPEDPANWNVKDDADLDRLRDARLNLIDSLIGYTPIVKPTETAKAVVLYDCWLQQSQMKLQTKQDCQGNFDKVFAEVNEVYKDTREKDLLDINKKYKWVKLETPQTVAAEAAAAAKLKKELAEKARQAALEAKKSGQSSQVYGPSPNASNISDKALITDQSDKTPDLVFIAYFDKNNDQLNEKAKSELDRALDEIKNNKPKNISVNGHTDRSFGSSESLIVSKKRADIVRDYLISKGIAKDSVRTYGFGKTDNLVENIEGEEKPANNRAEIIFKKSQ